MKTITVYPQASIADPAYLVQASFCHGEDDKRVMLGAGGRLLKIVVWLLRFLIKRQKKLIVLRAPNGSYPWIDKMNVWKEGL